MKIKLIFLLLFSISSIALADIYKWTDEKGNVHFSDSPNTLPENSEKITENKKPTRITSGYFERIYRTPQPVQQIKPTHRQPFEELNKLNRDLDKSITKWQINANKAAENAKRTLALITLAGIIYFTLWVWAFLDILKNQFARNDKIVWWLTITMIPVLGMIAYITIGRKQRLIQEEEPNYHEFYKDDLPGNNENKQKEKICKAPGCYGTMRIRTKKDGKKYWVCSDYNKCKTAIIVEEAVA